MAQSVSFAEPTQFAAGDVPTSVAVGDFNADGDPDLAVANTLGDSVSILLGEAGGSFGAETSFAVGDNPISLAVGDFNADGDPDLAVANDIDDSVSVLLGEAGGSFGAETIVDVGNDPGSVAVGDFNTDGDPDLVVANSGDDNVSVLLGEAGGSFGAQTTFAVEPNGGPVSVAVGDFNADGDADLAVANNSRHNVSVLLGEAGGSFGAETTFDTGDFPASVAVGDFNADSDPDLAVANSQSDNVSILLGEAGGSFGAETTFAVGNDPFSVAVGDFSKDGDPDLAVAIASQSVVSVLLGEAGGSFTGGNGFATGQFPFSVAVGDFNADGDPDLVVANSLNDNVSVALNNTFPPASPTFTDTDPDSPANDSSPRVKGLAEPGSTVRLYTTPDCSDAPAATGSAADFASPGLEVSVPDDSVTTFRAALTSDDLDSPCSSSSITYTQVSTPPVAALASSPNPVLTDETVNFDASASTGLGIGRYEWDLDGDGSFETDTGAVPTASRSYSAPAEITPGVRVTNPVGQSTADTALSIRLRPPSGELGISINSGAQFTNDPQVTVAPVWPRLAQTIVISNDGGFGDRSEFAVAPGIPWALESSGAERLPKTVYARFKGGESGPETYQDDIILDETAPKIRSVTANDLGAAKTLTPTREKQTYRIRVKARDRTSGLKQMQVTNRKRRPGDLRAFRKRSKFASKRSKSSSSGPRIYVRVRDRAGNFSSWKRAEP